MREEFSFVSADGKTKIHGVRWRPEGEPRYIVQLTHGMVEFIDRYAGFAEYLNGKGVLAVGHDHLGHGDSVTTKDDWGFFAKDNPSGVLVEDMHAVRVMTQRQYPDLPYFMLGHSMGSYLLRKYLAFHGEGLAGAVIMGTGFVPPATASMGLALCKTIALFRGWHYRSASVSKLVTGGGSYKQFDATGTNLTAKLDAENCLVDRKTNTGWVDGNASMVYGEATVKGRGIYFSLTDEFIKIFSQSEIRTKGGKINLRSMPK